jgi:hypothetical protein
MEGAGEMGGGMDMGQMMGVLPNLGGLMKWIQQSDLPQPDWAAAERDALSMEQAAQQQLGQAQQGIGAANLEQEFQAGAPPASGDFLDRMFSNLATGLTGNPMFAQAAIASQAQRDQGRRQDILRQNIAAYERAANAYEKAGNYSQAVKMRKMEYAERKRESEEKTKAGLAGIGMQEFSEIKQTLIRAGVQLSSDGTMSVIGKPSANTYARMNQKDWNQQMSDLLKAQATLPGMKVRDKNDMAKVRGNVNNSIASLAATPTEGMTAEQLQLQIQRYASGTLDDAGMAELFINSLKANPDLPGAEAYLAIADVPPPSTTPSEKGAIPEKTAALAGKRTPSTATQPMIPAHKPGASMAKEPGKYQQMGESAATPMVAAGGLFAKSYMDAVRGTLSTFGVSDERADEAMRTFSMRMQALAMAETLKVADKMKKLQEQEKAKAEKAATK